MRYNGTYFRRGAVGRNISENVKRPKPIKKKKENESK